MGEEYLNFYEKNMAALIKLSEDSYENAVLKIAGMEGCDVASVTCSTLIFSALVSSLALYNFPCKSSSDMDEMKACLIGMINDNLDEMNSEDNQ